MLELLCFFYYVGYIFFELLDLKFDCFDIVDLFVCIDVLLDEYCVGVGFGVLVVGVDILFVEVILC